MNTEQRPLNEQELKEQKRLVGQALLDDKELQCSRWSGLHNDWSGWGTCDIETLYAIDVPTIRYRIKPTKKLIPLTQKDFPPFCQLNFGDDAWYTIMRIGISSIYVSTNYYTFVDLVNNKAHYRGTDGVVHPCWKEVEE